jgi:hypothetical protein
MVYRKCDCPNLLTKETNGDKINQWKPNGEKRGGVRHAFT